ncbi:hypothetical protein [Paenibacillus sp. BAC0078]
MGKNVDPILLNHISQTLPNLSNSVNQILDHISKEKYQNKELLSKLAVLNSNFNFLEIEELEDFDAESRELYKRYVEGLGLLIDGVGKFLVLIADEIGFPERVKASRDRLSTQEISTQSAIDDLFNGSKIIASVVEEATGDN